MYDLKRVSENGWVLERDKKQVFSGDLTEVTLLATIALEFKIEEIEMAVDEMLWMDHNVAHFGIKKRFIFTYDTKEQKV